MILLSNCTGRIGMDAACAVLRRGGSALDAVEAGVRAVEADPTVDSVGHGGHPNLLGEVQCDASISDGDGLRVGSVGALRGFLHAISVARAVMERSPHVFLVGEGAERFAREISAERSEMLTEAISRRHQEWMQARCLEESAAAARAGASPQLGPEDRPLLPLAWEAVRDLPPGGTTVFLALDGRGSIAGATSSSGLARKYPGRLGDSPVIGAGLYADSRFGACGCTHTGEMTIRLSTARTVILDLENGRSLESAARRAIADLRGLRGGLLGPVLLHVIDREGRVCAVSSEEVGPHLAACIWRAGMERWERLPLTVPPRS